MESALAWIGQIASWIGQFFPRWHVVPTYQAGVKYVRGKKVVPFGPGIVFWWPVTTMVRDYPIARQSVNLPTQTLTTSDDHVVAVGLILIYKVDDIVALFNTWDSDEAIKDIAAGALHDVCSTKTYEELKDQPTLKRELRQEMRKRLRPLGVRVLQVSLTDRAPAAVLKLIQSAAADA
jgi:hypothetical protein